MSRVYHVAKNGNDQWEGSSEKPFLTISRAAGLAEKGDRVVVHAGEYREWVKPENSGNSNIERIIYEAAPGEKVVIKGSERIHTWEKTGTIWKVVLPNSFFGEYNPYSTQISGDWLIPDKKDKDGQWIYRHTGDVYLNGRSFYEADSLAQVEQPAVRTEAVDHWTRETAKVKEPDQTKYVWYAEVDAENTTIYANFHEADPNQELVEINVRKCCFYPVKTGRNYITVRGFELAHAACPWTPPTADQPGLLGANWSRGWIIEHNIIHDAKCSAISIGKEASTGHNACTQTHQKPGYHYQMEAVFLAAKIGWSRENIGGHIIRNNTIYDCGQNGIVGHMGCVFSEIYGNEIYNIAIKREFFGHEIAGIKLHAAIDVQIHHNRIYDCTLGTWLDWQAQGTRVSKNLYYRNNRDLMIEVTHGPCLVDHNIFASAHTFDDFAQGTAFVGNLCCGKTYHAKVLDRSTPYHLPHSTDVLGTTAVYGGDDRYYNNIFVGSKDIEHCGTAVYDRYTVSYEAYIADVLSQGVGDHENYLLCEQPVYIAHNVYTGGAEAYKQEKESYTDAQFAAKVCICEEADAVYLELDAQEEWFSVPAKRHSTETLGTCRMVNAPYEAPDGSSIMLDTDYLGDIHGEKPVIGPLESLRAGHNRIKVWG